VDGRHVREWRAAGYPDLSYLRISRRKLGLLLFFGPTPEVERVSIA
jgi:hypothetical protein